MLVLFAIFPTCWHRFKYYAMQTVRGKKTISDARSCACMRCMKRKHSDRRYTPKNAVKNRKMKEEAHSFPLIEIAIANSSPDRFYYFTLNLNVMKCLDLRYTL